MFAHSSVNWRHCNTLIHFFGDYKVHLNHKCIYWLRSPLQFKLQSATKWVETLCPNLGFFLRFPDFKRGKYSFSFLIPSKQCCAAVQATYRKQQTPHLWVEGTGEGRGFFCALRLPYLSTMSQQFCRRLSESQKWPYILKKINSSHFFTLGCKTPGGFLFAMFDIIMPILEQLLEYGDFIIFSAWHHA